MVSREIFHLPFLIFHFVITTVPTFGDCQIVKSVPPRGSGGTDFMSRHEPDRGKL